MFASKDSASRSLVHLPRRLLSGVSLLAFSTGLLWGADSWQWLAPVPGARAAHSAVWTGREMIVWGGGIDGQFLGTGARYNPTTDNWRTTSLSNAPSPRWFHAAVWTGGEMIVWGGRADFAGVNNFNNGARYNPTTDRWRPISTQGAPSARSQCAAVWTGSEMIIWGGATEDGIELNDGARYNPETDTWAPISSASGLEPRMEPTGIWTGEELIVFGGMKFTDGQLSFGNGARYHPATDSWTPLPDVNSPGSRTGHTAVWTGERMMVWGGYAVPDQVALNTGASYDPGANRWTPLPMADAPIARFYHAAVWTGTEMIVWGGQVIDGTMLDSGARYKPALESWTETTQTDAPGKRQFWRPDLGIWTGSGMLICAGSDYPASLDSTFVYRPAGTNAPPPPPPPTSFDLSRDFSPTVNPGEIWSYGWLEELSGPFHPLSFPKSFYSDNGQPISAWQVTDDLAPGVYRHMGDGQAVSAGGAFTAPPGTMWFWPGNDGTPRNFGVIRFRVPAGRAGNYRIETSVQSLFDGPISKDSEFHVTRNGEELFGRFIAPNSGTGYSNTISLVAGDTIDFAVGRGEDGSVEHSGLKIAAALTLVTNLPPPRPPALAFDLSRDYSLAANPNGPWSYGYLTALDGTFGLLSAARTFGADNGVPIGVWELNTYQLPIVAKVLGPGTAHSDGDHFTAEPGTIYFAPGADGAPENFGVVRFTVPEGAGGQYRLATFVRSLFDNTRSRDADFHVLKNGQELFGEFLPPNSGTSYSNVLALAPGDRLDFAIGRGADGLTADTGLKIQATLIPLNLVTNPPPPARFYDVSRDFSPTHNPAGVWSYGYETALGGTFMLLTFPLTSFGDNPVPVDSWAKNGYEPVAVYHNGTTNTSISDGGAGVFPPGTTWFYPGIEGHADNYGVIRFTVPAGGAGTYQLQTEVRAYLDGSRSGDTDFHVLKNGVELFGQFIPGNSGAAYSNRLSLVESDTIDFAVGRGRDDIAFDSGLKIRASIALVSAPPPPPPAVAFDLSRNYSLAANPNGPWSYGYLTDLDGTFGLLGASRTFSADNGVPIAAWELNTYQLPGVWKVLGPEVAHSDGDHFTGEPGTVYFAPGADGAPENFGVVRFTVPPGAGGRYGLQVAVQSLFDGSRSRDADFHVLKNGEELFGEFLPPNSGTGYTNVLALMPGDRLDFAIGRGADGLTADTGLKIQATLSLATNTIPPRPPPTHCAPVPAGLVAWWPAEGNPNDVVGTNSGALFGGASYTTGKVHRAFAFPGGDSGVKIPASPNLDIGSGGGLTIEGWIKPADLSIRGPLVEWNRGGSNIIEWGVHLCILRPDEFELGAGNLFANLTEASGQPHWLMAPGGTVQANIWQHIALTYDKASGEARLYRDGEVVASENLGTFTPETSYDLYLGQRPAGDGTLSYHGLLDEIAVYDRALNTGEVAAIAGAGASGKCRIPAELDELVDLILGVTVPVETQPLLASLEVIRTSIARGNLFAAISQLQAFQNQVRVEVAPLTDALAEEILNLAQQIIEALDPTGIRRVTFVAAAETPLRLDRCVLTPTGSTCVEGSGAAGGTYCVQRSTNLVNWEPIGCATEIDDGKFEFIDANPTSGGSYFYRLYEP